jgi:hypothetical protein
VRLRNRCSPPDLTPFRSTCYPQHTMLDVSTSLQCSNAFVEQYFVTNPAVVEQLTEVNMAMHDLCTSLSFTTQVCSLEATP